MIGSYTERLTVPQGAPRPSPPNAGAGPILVFVFLTVREDEPAARPLSPGSTACSPESLSSSSSITIARWVLVTTASDRPDELVSHVSSCPLPILDRRASSTSSDDTGVEQWSLIIQDSVTCTTISRTGSEEGCSSF